MFCKYTHNDILHYYNLLVNKAIFYESKGLYKKSIDYVECASLLQYNYNSIYSDLQLENILDRISKKQYVLNKDNTSANIILWYDTYSLDNRGLTQQYIDAINSIEGKFIYVAENKICPNGKAIYDQLKKSDNCLKIIELEGSRENKTKRFYELLYEYKPEKVFLHLLPWTTIPLIPLYAFPLISVYQVNLTDHAFWLGSKRINYSLEFRNYGATVSVEKRGLKKEQLIMMPYYPWANSEYFLGFPQETEGKKIIFSGGSIYKITGKNNFFFYLIKDMLDQNPDSVFLFAGEGNDEWLRNLIKKYKLENRFFLLGNRRDICEVFKHSDIYVGTYPFPGGLMSQYAAMYKKPLLIYSDNGDRTIENIVCTKKYADFTFFTREKLLEEVRLLLSNDEYRKERGSFFHDLLLKQSDFRKNFYNRIKSNKTNIDDSYKEDVDYEEFCYKNLEWLNKMTNKGSIESKIIKTLLFSSLYYTPKFIINILPLIFRTVTNKILKRCALFINK